MMKKGLGLILALCLALGCASGALAESWNSPSAVQVGKDFTVEVSFATGQVTGVLLQYATSSGAALKGVASPSAGVGTINWSTPGVIALGITSPSTIHVVLTFEAQTIGEFQLLMRNGGSADSFNTVKTISITQDGGAGGGGGRYTPPVRPWPTRNTVSGNSGLDASAATIVGVSDYAEVRYGPGESNGVKGKAYAGERVGVLAWSNGWCKILYNNATTMGWVNGKYIGQ